MLSYCTDYLATMPDITVYVNCDTRLAINIKSLGLSEYDEFIFAIKNYDYVESSYAFLFRARNTDMDKNGEVIFKIDPDASKAIKPGAFYTMSALVNAFNRNAPTEHRKLTENGCVNLEYGAQDMALAAAEEPSLPFTLLPDTKVRLEAVNNDDVTDNVIPGVVVNIALEETE